MQPWGELEKLNWFKSQSIKRNYKTDVLDKIENFDSRFMLVEYGRLSIDPDRYPLFLVHTKNVDRSKPTVLITGGVHGYETSGITGAMRMVETQFDHYSKNFNLVAAICVSPWGYETINRWNPSAVDPNRSFYKNGPSEEARLLMQAVEAFQTKHNLNFLAHIDLHETTDTDQTVFRPALAARDGKENSDNSEIPDGFYLVGDTNRVEADFQAAIITAVAKITHIAPADSNGNIIGVPIEHPGVINYDCKGLHLCTGMTDSPFVTTTEVYPDSKLVTEEDCVLAQVGAIRGALEYLLALKK
jgi:hypothetical protein